MELKNVKIGFLGAGNIAQAIGGGLIKSGIVDPQNVYVSAPSDRSLGVWKAWGANTSHANGDVVEAADVILLCMKPHQLIATMPSIICEEPEKKLLVSTAAGVTLSTLDLGLRDLNRSFRIIRSMPNTPAQVGAGCTVIAPHDRATPGDVELVKKIFGSVGKCELLDEGLFAAAGGIAGSSPAFIFVLIEAMADAGVKAGLRRDLAQTLAAQAVMGSGKMVLESGQHPGQLKDAVCSPGGTTIAGIAALERAGFRFAIMSGCEAAVLRSKEMTSSFSR